MLAALGYFTAGWISEDRPGSLRAVTDLPA